MRSFWAAWRASSDKVRVTTHLYQASKDRQLWSESYEKDLRDVLTLQSEIAHAIVGEIRIQVTAQEKVRLAKTRSVNPEAYDAYLRGSFLFAKHSRAEQRFSHRVHPARRGVGSDVLGRPRFAVARGRRALLQLRSGGAKDALRKLRTSALKKQWPSIPRKPWDTSPAAASCGPLQTAFRTSAPFTNIATRWR